MNLTSPTQIRELLASYNLRPKKQLGQNFLIDRNILTRLADATLADDNPNVMEIGPGLGVVTNELIDKNLNLVCVEADKALEKLLRETLGDGFELVMADFLKLDLNKFLSERADGRWSVIGNLPYYITTPIITKLLESKEHIKSIVMMIQREVAQRLRAKAGSSEYGSITLFINYHCTVESVVKVSRNVFYPAPAVDSEVIKLIVRTTPPVDVKSEELMFKIIHAAFGKRRKTLINALSGSAELAWDKDTASHALSAADIDPSRRGETLTLEEFAQIANAACN